MINLKHVTFIIPIKIDSQDRLRNYRIIIDYLTKEFDTNIIVGESDQISHKELLDIHPSIEYHFIHNESELFHRTRILNYMTKISKTNIICNYDTDVIFPTQQYLDAIQLVEDGKTLVFPYGGKFLDVPTTLFDKLIEKDFINIGELEVCHPNSLGGAFFFDKEKYGSIGWENENFISWGWEDNERIVRLTKMGHQWGRTNGVLYHLNHERTLNCVPGNPMSRNNQGRKHENNPHDTTTIKKIY